MRKQLFPKEEQKDSNAEDERKPNSNAEAEIKPHVPLLDLEQIKAMENGTYMMVVNGKEMKISVSGPSAPNGNKVSETDSDVIEDQTKLTVPESDYENKNVDGINDGESSDLSKSFKQIDTAPPSSGRHYIK